MDKDDRRGGKANERREPAEGIHERASAAPALEDPQGALEGALDVSGDGEVTPIRRKVRLSKRRMRMRAKTIAMKRLTKEEIRLGALLYPPEEIERPKDRGECQAGARPCPFVACKHHLYLDVNPETGSIKLNFPDLEVWEMKETCSLDVADRGGVTLEEVGEILNLTRERIRQVEVRGLLKLKMASPDLSLPPAPPPGGND
jgi:hypothetical protein